MPAVDLLDSINQKYDNGSSGLSSTTAKDAIDELMSRKVENTGDTFTGQLNFPDNIKIVLGDGGDLEVFHDGLNSYVREVGQGSLGLGGTTVDIRSSNLASRMALFTENNAVDLYFNNSVKFSTTNSGIEVFNTASIPDLRVNGKRITAYDVFAGNTLPHYMSESFDLAYGRYWIAPYDEGTPDFNKEFGYNFESTTANWYFDVAPMIGSSNTNDTVLYNNMNASATINGVLSVNNAVNVDGVLYLKSAGSEGGQLSIYNPDDITTGSAIDISVTDQSRWYSVRDNANFIIGQTAGTGGSLNLVAEGVTRIAVDNSGADVTGTLTINSVIAATVDDATALAIALG